MNLLYFISIKDISFKMSAFIYSFFIRFMDLEFLATIIASLTAVVSIKKF